MATPVYIGNKSPGYRADAPAKEPAVVTQATSGAALGDSVLVCLVTWTTKDGTPVEPTTASIAARLGIQAESYTRDQLNLALTSLRKQRLVAYERDARGHHLWRLTGAGRRLAETL